MKIEKDFIDNLEDIEITGYNNGGRILKIDENTLAKIFYDNQVFIKNRERNTELLLKKTAIEKSSYPIEKIYFNDIYIGYTMPYFKNTKTFKKGLYSTEINNKNRINILKDVIKSLKLFHQNNIVFGDIHLDNYIFDQNNGYIIDLDDVIIDGNDHQINKLYNLRQERESKRILINNECIDNIKASICFLSLIFNHNFEPLAMYGSLNELIELFAESLDDKILKEYFETLFTTFEGKPIYMDEILYLLNDSEKVKTMRKKINTTFENMI